MVFSSLTDIMDKELHLYLEMQKLHAEKKSILIKNDLKKLAEIDTKILENLESVKNLQEIIKKYSLEVPEEHREKLLKLGKEISILNRTNMELIKHQIIMADKKLMIIINACTEKTSGYSKYGKLKDMEMTTIIHDV